MECLIVLLVILLVSSKGLTRGQRTIHCNPGGPKDRNAIPHPKNNNSRYERPNPPDVRG